MPVDEPQRFCRVIQLNHGVVVKAVLLGKDRGSDMGRERSDLDVVDLKCVVHVGNKKRAPKRPVEVRRRMRAAR